MNEKGKPSTGGQQPDNKSSFGQIKNQGRGSFSENSSGNIGRSRSNAISEGPGARSRSNAITGATEGFKQVKNEGRGTANDKSDRPGSNFSSSPGAKQNLGRNSYQSSNDNRNNLSPSQKVGFNLVSGFMDKLIKQAERSNTQQNAPKAKRAQQGTGNQFGQQDEEDKRQRSIQSSQRDDDEDISAGDFFKRLNSAITDPKKFKKEAGERAQARELRNNKNEKSPGSQQGNSPQNNSQQDNAQQRQQSGGDNEQISGKAFFQRLQGATKDPAGFKRRVEAQKRTGDKAQSGPSGSLRPSNPQGQQQSAAQQQQEKNQPSKAMPTSGNKTGSQGIKKSPRN